LRSNAGMANRQGDVDLRFAQVSAPQLELWLGLDAHTSAASSRLNWRPHQFEWTLPFRGKTKSGFCACAITFRTSYTKDKLKVPLSFSNKFSLCIKYFFCYLMSSRKIVFCCLKLFH